MIKPFSIVCLALFLFAACKKDKPGAPDYLEKKLRSVNYVFYDYPYFGVTSRILFLYSGSRLTRTLRTDSSYNRDERKWTVTSAQYNYLYNAAGKLAKYITPNFEHRFVYDAENRLIQRIRSNSFKSDTIYFSYENGVTGTYFYGPANARYKVVYAFGKDLESVTMYAPGDKPISKTTFQYNSVLNLLSKNFLKDLDPLLKANFTDSNDDFIRQHWLNAYEPTGHTLVLYGSPYSSSSVTNYTIEHNDNNYPAVIWLSPTLKLHYTYY